MPRLLTLGLFAAAFDAGVVSDDSIVRSHIHMVAFGTEQYKERFKPSLRAKKKYAKHFGYQFWYFGEDALDCSKIRPMRWRGDLRFCKLAALSKVLNHAKVADGDWIFWHDVDTFILNASFTLDDFIAAAGPDVDLIFTENRLSLNNGVFFLRKNSWGKLFFDSWINSCLAGEGGPREWPNADNGCLMEALLQQAGGLDGRYTGACQEMSLPSAGEEINGIDDMPESKPNLGPDLSKCFEREMAALGHPCCGEARKIPRIAFLTGRFSFNHHACDKMVKTYEAEGVIPGETCYEAGMFLLHERVERHEENNKATVREVKRILADQKKPSDEL